MDNVLEVAIANGTFPGCVALVGDEQVDLPKLLNLRDTCTHQQREILPMAYLHHLMTVLIHQ